ncbi:MAG: peptide chain release factor 2 [Dehalococcoidia bacterium]|nr:peptide chain release factor 2 [Dehalococcoidia bacterium]MSQ17275.1 peptide chain release factor 2 [Dehalococcoidia bacterium]
MSASSLVSGLVSSEDHKQWTSSGNPSQPWCRRLTRLPGVFDLADKEASVVKMEQEAAAPGFWDDPRQAQRKMQQLMHLKELTGCWRNLRSNAQALLELTELGLESGDSSMQEQLEAEYAKLAQTLAQEEMNLTLSGPYDDRPAIVSLYAGAGGTDSQDWVEMLLAMYVRWGETHRRPVQVMDLSYGEEAGLRSATLEIGGTHACGYLRSERGVHRLVRLSPFDPAHSRHTSFAQVEVVPVAEAESETVIRPEDLKMDFFRSSGPGGQNVQKVSTAVRLTHLPSGIIVTCQTERSQHQNREYAMRILQARLLARQNEERAQELAKQRGERMAAEFGSQIRSYVLHPYKMVKDHRTDYQSNNPEAVLNGDLNGFMEAFLMSRVGG